MSTLADQMQQQLEERRRIKAEIHAGGEQSRRDFANLQRLFWVNSNRLAGEMANKPA